jgi:GWxTD domain-containing protein
MKALRFAILIAITLALCLFAADEPKPATETQRETISRPLTEREKKRNDARLKKELETPYKKWLSEDVAYIITDEEASAFKKLQTDEEREQFIEQFWLRRDPTPDTIENEYKEEHYRRIAYANEHYASGFPGWKSDRGMIYIKYGPPDEIDDHASGGTYNRPQEEGGGSTSTYPFEKWRYRYLEDIGTNIEIEFVDTTMTGEFHMSMDPSEKDALLYVPNAGLTQSEEMGLTDKSARFSRTDGTHLGTDDDTMSANRNQFARLEQFSKLQKAPGVKFKDLEALVESRITYNTLPMKVRVDFFPVTDSSVLTNVTVELQNKDMQFAAKDGVQRATVNILGRVTTMTRRRVQNFEDTVVIDSPPQLIQEYAKQRSLYQSQMALAPGTYRLDVAAKDITGGTTGSYEVSITVPRIDPDKLSSSNLVLADLIEPVPMRSIGAGQFVIGGSKVRPRVNEEFKQNEKLGLYLKLYNFGQDEKTRKPSGDVEYEVLKAGTEEKVIDYTEDLSVFPNLSAAQVTVQKLLPLNTLGPGKYTIRLKITDKIRNQVLTQSAKFTVI